MNENDLIDDPRLTAYALGELDETERAEIEALLREDAAARAEVDAIRAQAAELQLSLHSPLAVADGAPAPRLTDEQRRRIADAAGAKPASDPAPIRRAKWGQWIPAAAIAASFVGAAVWFVQQGDPRLTTVNKSVEDGLALSDGSATGARDDGDEASSLSRLQRMGYLSDRSDGAPSAEAVPPAAAAAGDELVNYHEEIYIPYDANQALDAQAIEQLNALGYTGGAAAAPSVADGSVGALTGRVRKVEGNLALQSGSNRNQSGRKNTPQSLAHGEIALVESVPDRQGFPGGELYYGLPEWGFVSPRQQPLSTFSIDVDTASYANVRRFLEDGQLPPQQAVRLEELVNYFSYAYPWGERARGATTIEGDGDEAAMLAEPVHSGIEPPLGLFVDSASAPWAPQHRLVRVAIRGRPVPAGERPAVNLVFVIDTSGSMEPAERLPLLKSALRLLVPQLRADDRLSIVTYSGDAAVALPSTPGDRHAQILSVIDGLSADGSTNGEAGLRLGYQHARTGLREGGVNRVLLATDGDFNVGAQTRGELEGLIASSAKGGVFLTVLGFGTGNLKDSNLELLADQGDGQYAYIDSLDEARKVLAEQSSAALVAVAKDVKIQVEFNPGKVSAYRLLGYENRALAAQDFNDDRKDAGDIGAGQSVTALYEIVPAGVPLPSGVDQLKYQVAQAAEAAEAEMGRQLVESPELLTLKLRWKEPAGGASRLMTVPLVDGGRDFASADADLRFATAVAAFGLLLRGSSFTGTADWDDVMEWARGARGADDQGYRAEFVRLVELVKGLTMSDAQGEELRELGYIR